MEYDSYNSVKYDTLFDLLKVHIENSDDDNEKLLLTAFIVDAGYDFDVLCNKTGFDPTLVDGFRVTS